MDPQDVLIAMAVEFVLERERQKKRRMEESLRADRVALREKVRERSMLKRKKQGMLAEEAAKKKLVDEFMVFMEANGTNDLENAQKFDEKTFKNNIVKMMNSNSGENGEFSCGFGDRNVLGIDLGLEDKATKDAIVAPVSSEASGGGDNGGFAGGYGGINDAVENANNLGRECVTTPTEGTNSDGGEGCNAGGCDGSNRRN